MQQTILNPRSYGIVLGAASIVLVVFMAMHPTVHAHDAAEFILEATQEAAMTSTVHGVLIATMALLVLGFTGYCDWMGSHQLLVRGGMIAYVTGAIAGLLAATANGLIVPELLNSHDGDATEIAQQLHAALMLCHLTGEACSRILVVAWSAAVMLWSCALIMRSGGLRIVGIVGLVCGFLPALLLFAGHLRMDVHGFGAFVVAQAIWYLAIAVVLYRGGGAVNCRIMDRRGHRPG